jgi:hypothetical protein
VKSDFFGLKDARPATFCLLRFGYVLPTTFWRRFANDVSPATFHKRRFANDVSLATFFCDVFQRPFTNVVSLSMFHFRRFSGDVFSATFSSATLRGDVYMDCFIF